VVRDARTGEIAEIHCTVDPSSRGGMSADGRRVKGTLHWVSAMHSIGAEMRLYDQLFNRANPDDVEEGKAFTDNLNPNSLQVVRSARLEPSLADAKTGQTYQFMRKGYFCLDPESRPGELVFNRTIALRDSWAKIQGRAGQE